MSHVKSAGPQTEVSRIKLSVIQSKSDPSQINVCDSGLHAIDHANTRGGSAYAASGIGACQCRHMLVKGLRRRRSSEGRKVIYFTYFTSF